MLFHLKVPKSFSLNEYDQWKFSNVSIPEISTIEICTGSLEIFKPENFMTYKNVAKIFWWRNLVYEQEKFSIEKN